MREIRKLFQPDGIMVEVAMTRSPNKPLGKSNRIVRIYLLLFAVTYAMNTVISLQNSQLTLLGLTTVVLVSDLVVFCTIWLSKSSFIEPSKAVKIVKLLETFDSESLCPFCEVIRLPKSRHCNICNRCVDRYDHHCPWVNNCVGRTNHSRFYVHLILVITYCTLSIVNAFKALISTE